MSSLSRDSNNQLSIGTIDVDITKIRLYGNGSTQFGILDKTIDLNTYTADSGTAATVERLPIDFANADDKVSFTVAQNGGAAVTVNINQATLTAAGLSDTKVRSNADLAAVLNQALADAGISGLTASVDGADHVIFSSLDDFDHRRRDGRRHVCPRRHRPRPEGHRR